MAERYPAVEPYESGMLAVTDGHRMYWEMCGAPDGTAAVSLHGGPGSGVQPRSASQFRSPLLSGCAVRPAEQARRA